MWSSILSQFVAAAVVLLLSRLFWRRWKYDLHKIPKPPGLPILGHTWEMIFGKEFKQRTLYVADKFRILGHPKIIRLDFMGNPLIYVRDVEFVKNVMMSKTKPFPRFGKSSEMFLPLMGNDKDAKFIFKLSYFTPYHKAIRKIYATAMQAQNLKKVTPKILDRIDTMIDIIEKCRKNGPVDLSDLLTRLTLDVVGSVAFETNMGGLDGSRHIHRLFGEVKHITMDNFTNPLLMSYCKMFPQSSTARRRKMKIQALRDEYAKLVQFFQGRDDPPEGDEPMWYALKTIIDPETGARLPFNSMLAEVALTVSAGMDTTGQQLGGILLLLATHPRVTQTLLKELGEHDLYGRNAREVTYDDLGELPYLSAVIKEGMRVAYVVVSSAPRMVPEDMNILGYRIPKNTLIFAPGIRGFGTKEEWGDPDVFRPERWLSGEDLSDKYYMPFSVGPRDCIGQKLAMLEMRLTILKLMTRYELKIEGTWQEVLGDTKDGIVMEPENGLWFEMTPREVGAD